MLISIFIVLCILFLWLFVIPMKFSDIDESAPGGKVEGYITGLKLHIRAERLSTLNEERIVDEKDVDLTPIERLNIRIAFLNPRFDRGTLSNYTYEPNQVIASKAAYRKYWDELYAEGDLNKDGIITRREFADWIVLDATPWGALRRLTQK